MIHITSFNFWNWWVIYSLNWSVRVIFIRFPNDVCTGTSSRNGTCYTEVECSNKGGLNSGSCSQVTNKFKICVFLIFWIICECTYACIYICLNNFITFAFITTRGSVSAVYVSSLTRYWILKIKDIDYIDLVLRT